MDFSKQVPLRQIGAQAIEKLKNSSVLVVGAGGLGCNVLMHLAGAGVGTVGVCDFDTVSQSNLNRQFLYNYEDIGKPKANLAAQRLSLYAPDCNFIEINCKITQENAPDAVSGFDLVILACDSFKTRLIINKACVQKSIPLVNAGVAELEGNVFLCVPHKTPCLYCLYENAGESPSKNTLSAAAGVVGSFAALTAIMFLANSEYEDIGKLILIDMHKNEITKLSVKKRGSCKICNK